MKEAGWLGDMTEGKITCLEKRERKLREERRDSSINAAVGAAAATTATDFAAAAATIAASAATIAASASTDTVIPASHAGLPSPR